MPDPVFVLQPDWANLLIKPDEISDVLLDLGDGRTLVSSERHKARPRSGVVVAAGPDAPYLPGTRVVFDSHATTEFSDGTRMIESAMVRASADGAEDPADLMGESWKGHLLPPPGCLIVERAKLPGLRMGLWVPDSWNASQRSGEAEVLASAIDKYQKGDRVFLGGTVSRQIPLGTRGDVLLWIVKPFEVMARVLSAPVPEVEASEDIVAQGIEHLADIVDASYGFDEGELRAPR